MNRAFILAGGNLGDRAKSLAEARDKINHYSGRIINMSSIYETAPWGNAEQPDFLNQALEVLTTLNARQLIRNLLKAEKLMGRIREVKLGPRIIDLDLLFFNDEIHNYHLLQLPHPEIQNRRFVLAPMAEIAPDYIHPGLKKSIADLLKDCKDNLEVKKWSA
jgi:2-amino-4-hydroxy-6-hydroxymethyldihydropteridine diphosphokinase